MPQQLFQLRIASRVLAVIGQARLTGRLGRMTNFRSSIGKCFHPEFFNRLDAVITSNPLRPQNARDIARTSKI